MVTFNEIIVQMSSEEMQRLLDGWDIGLTGGGIWRWRCSSTLPQVHKCTLILILPVEPSYLNCLHDIMRRFPYHIGRDPPTSLTCTFTNRQLKSLIMFSV